MNSSNKAYFQVLEIADEVRRLAFDRTVISERYQDNSLKRKDSGHKSSALNVQFTQLTLGWINGLTRPAALFVATHILEELKLYNLLWHRPTSKKSSEKMIMRELVEKHIIFRTEVAGIYIVNPMKIWRGTIPGAVEATKTLLRVHKRPSLELIHDLRAKDDLVVKTSEDHYHQIGDFNTNMLEEPEEEYNKDTDQTGLTAIDEM